MNYNVYIAVLIFVAADNNNNNNMWQSFEALQK